MDHTAGVAMAHPSFDRETTYQCQPTEPKRLETAQTHISPMNASLDLSSITTCLQMWRNHQNVLQGTLNERTSKSIVRALGKKGLSISKLKTILDQRPSMGSKHPIRVQSGEASQQSPVLAPVPFAETDGIFSGYNLSTLPDFFNDQSTTSGINEQDQALHGISDDASWGHEGASTDLSITSVKDFCPPAVPQKGHDDLFPLYADHSANESADGCPPAHGEATVAINEMSSPETAAKLPAIPPGIEEMIFDLMQDVSLGNMWRESVVMSEVLLMRTHPSVFERIPDRNSKIIQRLPLIENSHIAQHMPYFAKAVVIHFLELRRQDPLSPEDIHRTICRLVPSVVGHEQAFRYEIDRVMTRMLTDLDQLFDLLRVISTTDWRMAGLMSMLKCRADALFHTKRDDEVDNLGIILTLEEMLRIADGAPKHEMESVDMPVSKQLKRG